jgi:hypothetical protein
MKAAFCDKRLAGLFAIALLLCVAASSDAAEAPLHALLIGGGPDTYGNGAEIESHLRYAAQLLPPGTNCFVHFTDGKSRAKTVSFTDSAKLTHGRRALNVLLPDNDFGPETQTRTPKLGVKINGAAQQDPIRRSLGRLAGDAAKHPAPALIYFAGHGSHNSRNEENNYFNLWNQERLYVSNLSAELARLPASTPIVLVMVQCYSGAFANVIFRHADPGNELDDHDIAGFFAAAKDREAAGCGTETDEPDYQDFSSYFFAALSGRDRIGQPISGADYDENHTVSLHEAFCYALIHDESSDTPTCTSDTFLRRFAPVPEPKLYDTSFEKILTAATPAQCAALKALSERLELSGEDRFRVAYDRLTFRNPIPRTSVQDRAYECSKALNELRQQTLSSLFSRWPALRWSESDEYENAAKNAERELNADPTLCEKILECQRTYDRANSEMENEEAFLRRFTTLCGSVVRAEIVRSTADARIKMRYEKLFTSEQRSLPLAGR